MLLGHRGKAHSSIHVIHQFQDGARPLESYWGESKLWSSKVINEVQFPSRVYSMGVAGTDADMDVDDSGESPTGYVNTRDLGTRSRAGQYGRFFWDEILTRALFNEHNELVWDTLVVCVVRCGSVAIIESLISVLPKIAQDSKVDPSNPRIRGVISDPEATRVLAASKFAEQHVREKLDGGMLVEGHDVAGVKDGVARLRKLAMEKAAGAWDTFCPRFLHLGFGLLFIGRGGNIWYSPYLSKCPVIFVDRLAS